MKNLKSFLQNKKFSLKLKSFLKLVKNVSFCPKKFSEVKSFPIPWSLNFRNITNLVFLNFVGNYCYLKQASAWQYDFCCHCLVLSPDNHKWCHCHVCKWQQSFVIFVEDKKLDHHSDIEIVPPTVNPCWEISSRKIPTLPRKLACKSIILKFYTDLI